MTSVLEAVLSEHPNVTIAAVIAREDDRWGERPIASIKPASDLQKEELRAFMEKRSQKKKLQNSGSLMILSSLKICQ